MGLVVGLGVSYNARRVIHKKHSPVRVCLGDFEHLKHISLKKYMFFQKNSGAKGR